MVTINELNILQQLDAINERLNIQREEIAKLRARVKQLEPIAK